MIKKSVLIFILLSTLLGCGSNTVFFSKGTPAKIAGIKMDQIKISVPSLGLLSDHTIIFLKKAFPKATFVSNNPDIIIALYPGQKGYFTFTCKDPRNGQILYLRSYIQLDNDQDANREIVQKSIKNFKKFILAKANQRNK